jgi:hypothetical protein
MPATFWAEPMTAAAFILNYLPSEAINDRIPWELWHDKQLSADTLRKLHPFGSIVHIYVPRERRWTLGKHAIRSTVGCLVGFEPSSTHESTANYKVWDFERKCFDVSHNLLFTTKFPKPNAFDEPSLAPPVPAAIATSESGTPPSSPSMESQPRSSMPIQNRPIFDSIVVEPPPALQVFASYSTLPDGNPPTLADALRRPDAHEWVKAMQEEMKSLEDNKTWTLCELPCNRKCIGTKWVFKTKRDGNNKFQRYKCRLVAKGYSQIAGIDFDKTFAPVVRIESVRALLAFAAFMNLNIIHVDCKTAFLNGNSDLEIYVQQPEGFVSKSYPRKVLRLTKSLYGLKQAPRIWYMLLCNVIQNLGFVALETDSSIYYSSISGVFLAVYVDDILIFGPSKSICTNVFKQLRRHFKMENMDYPTTFLGLNIVRNQQGSISINQTGYIDRMLARFQMTDAHSTKVPLNSSLPLLKATPLDKRADLKLYQEIIGSLNHLAVFSRPDISNAISQLSQFLQDPMKTHMKAARHILRYLKGTRHFCITYGGAEQFRIIGFSDANWGGDKNDRKSTTGYVFMINNGAVSWVSHKQSTVAVSTIKAEYMTLSDASREAIARSQLYQELSLKLPTPTILSDNNGALDVTEDSTNYQRVKHIDIRYHFVRHALHSNQIAIDHIPSAENPADILTKALDFPKHQHLVEHLNLC